MPATHHQTFQAYFHECDAYGQLHNLGYLRWMQEAAFGASAAVGYDFAQYDAMHYLWLVRETELEIHQPIAYGEQIDIKTWVMDFRRFRSRRAYEFTNRRTGELAAQANTDWVYVDAERLRPAKIPAEMQLAFFPEGPPAEEAPRERFPALPPPPGKTFSTQRAVHWHEIDQMWHVNNAMYLLYLEEAGNLANRSFGWHTERLRENGCRLTSRRQHIEYRLPAALGEQLEIVTWLSDVEDTTAKRHYQIQRAGDGTVLLQAQADLQWIDVESSAPVKIPAEFLRDLAPNIKMEPQDT
jgi:acyl-CoA thioester hydrolase